MTSAVAGILDKTGGIRVVVTEPWRMRHHVADGERLFVVPGLEVEEPVPWDDVPRVIKQTLEHVSKILAPDNKCGGCNVCCFTPFIKDGDFVKPSRQLCQRCSVGFGCTQYWRRPSACKSFQCEWLKSQSRNDVMAEELRPDRSGVMFTVDELVLEIHPTDLDRNEYPEVVDAYVRAMQAAGYGLKIVTGYYGEDKP